MTIIRQSAWAAGLAACVIATFGGAWAQTSAPAPAVVVKHVQTIPAAPPLRFNGQVEARQAVSIQARAQGFLKKVAFEEGSHIKAGDVLFEIEPDQMDAIVLQARAQVARANAAQNAARQTLSRVGALASRNTVSQASLDDAQAAFDVASADVQAAEATLATALLNLSYTRITSPISGMIGRSVFSEGTLVGPNTGPLARVVELDPAQVVFSITDRTLTDLRQKAATGGALDPNSLAVSLTLPNGTRYQEHGRVSFIDNEVSPQTGTIAVRAVFRNPDQLLVPGQIVSVEILDENAAELPAVPLSAVLQDRQGQFVFVVDKDNKVARRPVVTGARVGNDWTVTDGLKPGETIVVEGLQRIADGSTVSPFDQNAGGAGSSR